MPPLTLTPLTSLCLSTHPIPSHSLLPNTTTHKHPLLIYHSAFPASTSPSALEAHLATNGLTPQWRYTMYSQTHYHSTTHEVLCVFNGRARLLFGGEQNPGRVETEVSAGDAIVIPSGVGHRLVEDVDGGFEMVGAYPKGCSWDMCYGKQGEESKTDAVAKVAWLPKDPLYGDDGPVLWGREKLEKRGGGMSGL
ncbi:hypothetical protein EJ02DRAFT_460715 [Clathrospora elynae]|uniref:Cupin type-2 domain-containing protein n=1 Tax=Clathrospora elynae TaxID=706981 RepID=A0A6A5S9F3_9PLEO|nr:hypothetical protein EJ02DRAFT_460715 [Clathrospora elynae]